MRAASVLALALAASVPAAARQGSEGGEAPAVVSTGARAHLSFSTPEAEVGEPVRLVVEVTEAPGGERFSWLDVEPEPDASWVVLGSRRELPAAPPSDPAAPTVLRRTWELASLEPGSRAAPPAVREALEAAGVTVEGPDPVLEVSGVLAEGEDAPRPLHGFPPGALSPDEERGTALLGWAIGLGLLAAGLALLLARRAARRRWRAEPGPGPLARLALAERLDDPRETAFALSRLVREAADRRLARADGDGWTDEEWLARTAPRLPAAAASELETLLARVAEVKYGGARPTGWAVAEQVSSARRVLELVGAADGPGAPGGEAAR